MDLFTETITFEKFLEKLKSMAENVTKAHHLPKRGICLKPKYGTKFTDVITSYQVVISEPAFPATIEEMEDDSKRTNTPLVTFKPPSTKKWADWIMIEIENFILTRHPIPDSAEEYGTKKDDGFSRYMVPFTDAVVEWMKSIIEYRLQHFVTSAKSFGCCDLFEKCSDAKKCLHENLLYSTACAYRHNLEQGKIFYGTNKNI